jgi:nucleotide sugar dehydrogenase
MADTGQKIVAVVGLGYVGLPLAVRASERGYRVIGFDTNKEKIALLKTGTSPIEDAFLEKNTARFRFEATSDAKKLKTADIFLICVPTPVDESFFPNLEPVISASQLIADHAKKGALVILESTVNPGVSEEVVRPLFEQAGFHIGRDLFLAHCPERINPGDAKWNVTNIPRVVGSFDQRGLALAYDFYTSIVDGEIRKMKSIREAEAVKIVENSFRDINIAFVNELARSFDVLNIDVKDVILGAATKPFAFMAHYPSCGVGGHCIPVDPYYLIERAKQSGFDHKFLKIAREINNQMPAYTVERLQEALNEIKLPVNGTKVGVLGLSYKANIDDVRESPAFKVIAQLKKYGAAVATFDPHVRKQSSVSTLDTLLKKSQALVLVTNHAEFIETLTPALLIKNGIKVIIDGKNCLDKAAFLKAGIIYKGIGR